MKRRGRGKGKGRVRGDKTEKEKGAEDVGAPKLSACRTCGASISGILFLLYSYPWAPLCCKCYCELETPAIAPREGGAPCASPRICAMSDAERSSAPATGKALANIVASLPPGWNEGCWKRWYIYGRTAHEGAQRSIPTPPMATHEDPRAGERIVGGEIARKGEGKDADPVRSVNELLYRQLFGSIESESAGEKEAVETIESIRTNFDERCQLVSSLLARGRGRREVTEPLGYRCLAAPRLFVFSSFSFFFSLSLLLSSLPKNRCFAIARLSSSGSPAP